MKVLIYILLLSYFSLYSKVERITIEPKNRVNIFLNNISNYSSSLSDDKKSISILLKDNEFSPTYSQVSGSGIVKYVSITKNKDNLNIKIELSTERGYVAIPLPYSKSIMIEAFSWEGISANEDKYREALLAYESGLLDESKTLLKTIFDKDIPNAKAILGIILMQEGNVEEASPLLFEANKDSSNILDLNAALAQIFKFKGLESEFKLQDSLFKEKSELDSYPTFVLNGNPENIEIPEYYYNSEDESLLASEESNSISKESSGTFFQDYEDSSIKDILGFSDTYIIFIVIFAILSLLMLLYVYNKWKQSKIKEFKNMSKESFSEEIRQARKKQQQKLESIKEKNNSVDNETIESGNQNKSGNVLNKKYGQGSTDNSKLDNIQQFKVRPTKNVKETTNKEQLEKFLTNYIPLKRQEEVEKKEQQIDDDIVYDADMDVQKSSSPDINLALKLAEEKNKIKQKQLIELAKEKLERNEEEILKKAKEMGLEQGSVEEKMHLDEIEKNKELLSKLNKKFNVDNSNETDEGKKEDE